MDLGGGELVIVVPGRLEFAMVCMSTWRSSGANLWQRHRSMNRPHQLANRKELIPTHIHATDITMSTALPPTLGNITPAKEWSQNTHEEMMQQAGLANTNAPSQPDAKPATAASTFQASTVSSHPGGQVPENLTSTPVPTPISPVTVGAGQPGYGAVPMYETPQAGGAPLGATSPTATGAQTAPGLFEPNPPSVPIASTTQDYQSPPPLDRFASTTSTQLDIPGAWGEDKASAPVRSVGPEGGDQIARDAKNALNNAANQAPGFLNRLQDTIGNIVNGHSSTNKTQNVAGLLPAPGDNFTNNATTSPADRDLALGNIPPSALEQENNKPNLSSPPVDGVPVGETRQNPSTAHVGNYNLTTLPNSDEGNTLNPQPTMFERAQQAMSSAQDAAVGAYNHPTTQGTIGSAKDTRNHYLEKGMAALGLGAAAGYEAEKHHGEGLGDESKGKAPGDSTTGDSLKDTGNRYLEKGAAALGFGGAASEAEKRHEQHPIETTTTSLPPAVSQATSPESGLEAHIASRNTPVSTPSGAAPIHPIETTTTSLPPAVSQATSPESGLEAHIASRNIPVSTPSGAAPAKGGDVEVPVGASTYPSLEPYEGNRTSQGLESPAQPIATSAPTNDKGLPTILERDSGLTGGTGAAPVVSFTTNNSTTTGVTENGGARGADGWKSGMTGLTEAEAKGVQEGRRAPSAIATDLSTDKTMSSPATATSNAPDSPTSPTTGHSRKSSLGSKIKS
ncbi:hypothetical protein FRB94_014525, partial [Tulasnella sp. JGI-2019a]